MTKYIMGEIGRTSMKDMTDALWDAIEAGTLQSEATLLGRLIASTALDAEGRARIAARGADLVRQIRARVKSAHGLDLEPEVLLYGQEWKDVL